jgi:hypothetical protein
VELTRTPAPMLPASTGVLQNPSTILLMPTTLASLPRGHRHIPSPRRTLRARRITPQHLPATVHIRDTPPPPLKSPRGHSQRIPTRISSPVEGMPPTRPSPTDLTLHSHNLTTTGGRLRPRRAMLLQAQLPPQVTTSLPMVVNIHCHNSLPRDPNLEPQENTKLEQT